MWTYKQLPDSIPVAMGRSDTKYLLFLDESGTHDLSNVDPAFPVFVLLGVLVGEVYYQKTLVRRMKELKRAHLQDQDVILHSSHIRRMKGPFERFRNDAVGRSAFHNAIGDLFRHSRIRLYAVVVDKNRLRAAYLTPPNPYFMSLSILLSQVCGPAGVVGPSRPVVARIIAEARGGAEDRQLQREYQTFRSRGLHSFDAAGVQRRRPETVERLFPRRVDFARKHLAIAGLELADLAAYPIAQAYFREDQSSAAFQCLLPRLRGSVVVP